MSELNSKIVNATKWSAITEVMAKLVSPISSMVLARVLTPETFGVVATLNIQQRKPSQTHTTKDVGD